MQSVMLTWLLARFTIYHASGGPAPRVSSKERNCTSSYYRWYSARLVLSPYTYIGHMSVWWQQNQLSTPFANLACKNRSPKQNRSNICLACRSRQDKNVKMYPLQLPRNVRQHIQYEAKEIASSCAFLSWPDDLWWTFCRKMMRFVVYLFSNGVHTVPNQSNQRMRFWSGENLPSKIPHLIAVILKLGFEVFKPGRLKIQTGV